MSSLYADLSAANIPVSSHESDLYFLATDDSRAILASYQFRSNVTTFRDNIDGKLWFDAPFAYDPFWEHVQRVADGRKRLADKVGL